MSARLGLGFNFIAFVTFSHIVLTPTPGSRVAAAAYSDLLQSFR
jgi:hypothetical protein